MMKILTLLWFLVMLTTSPMTNCAPGQFNAVPAPIPVYHPKPVAGSNFGLLECPSGYTKMENGCGRFCYRLESQRCGSFRNASAVCKEEGADLLEPNVCTYPLFRGLAFQQQGKCGDYWIGGFRTLPDRNYVTVGGVSLPDSFQFWGTDQPSRTVSEEPGVQQACVQIDNGFENLLNDDFCMDRIGYICQRFL